MQKRFEHEIPMEIAFTTKTTTFFLRILDGQIIYYKENKKSALTKKLIFPLRKIVKNKINTCYQHKIRATYSDSKPKCIRHVRKLHFVIEHVSS